MRRRLIYVCAALLAMSLSGLLIRNQLSAAEEIDMNTNLTPNQRIVLESYLTTPSRIESGVLTPHEQRIIDLVPQIEAYLARRYPDHDFAFLRVSGSVLVSSQQVFTIQETVTGETFKVQATATDKYYSAWVIEDNYYALLKAPEVEAYIAALLEKELGSVKACVRLRGYYGDDYDPALTIPQLLESGLTLSVIGEAYTAAALPLSDRENRLEAVLQGRGLIGGLAVITLERMPEEDPDIKWAVTYADLIRERLFISLPNAALAGEEE